MDIKLLFLIAVLIIVAAAVLYFFYKTYLNRQDKKPEPGRTRKQEIIEFDAELRREYHLALNSGEREKAFTIGKKYYTSVLDGRFSDDIDQAISNDLSKFKKT